MHTFRMLLAGMLLSAVGQVAASQPAPLRLVTADGPPHMSAATQTGLDIDIARAALARSGHTISLNFMPLNRAFASLQSGKADVMLPYFNLPQEGLYLSQPYLHYRPTVFAHANAKGVQINTLSDLARYRVASFQGARGYFGPAFVAAIEQSPAYSEVQNMGSLVDMLGLKRAQVVVLDYWIFQHFYREKRHSYPLHALEEVIPAVPAVAVFNDRALRDAFDRGLGMLKETGEYETLLVYYQRD